MSDKFVENGDETDSMSDLVWVQIKSILRDHKEGISPENLLLEFSDRFKVKGLFNIHIDIYIIHTINVYIGR